MLSIFLMTCAPLCAAWTYSMHLAAWIAQRQIDAVVDGIARTSPNDAALWEAVVAGPAVALHEMMAQLSEGWGRGLGGLTFACFFGGLGPLMSAMNRPLAEGMNKGQDSPHGWEIAGAIIGTSFFLLPV